jgi:chemotaxis protein methyltransferase CheR
MPRLQLSQQDFEDLRGYIHKLCGLYLHEDKKYLVLQRLEDLVVDCGCADFREFARTLAHSPTHELHERIIAAITTNETSFFRDAHPFQSFQTHVLPKLAAKIKAHKQQGEARGPVVRIWSAGASTGQEPYSLAMLVHEYARANHYFGVTAQDFSILATDISSRVLDRARSGLFNDVEVGRGLSPERRERYFTREGSQWRLSEELRRLVEFQRMNLVEPFSMFCRFDVIFCRNVLIYFDEATKRQIIDGFHRKLNPLGYLVLGSAENLYALTDKFQSVMVGESILYQKTPE